MSHLKHPINFTLPYKATSLMYVNGMGIRGIARVTGITHPTMINWIKHTGERLPDAYDPDELPQVGELDQLETFVGKKKTVVVHSNGKRSVGRWGPTPNPSGGGEFGEMGGWGVWEKLKNIYPHHYHAGLPKKQGVVVDCGRPFPFRHPSAGWQK
ncbi:IS1 family transposase [Okeania hirsuta]|uniref:IS1 family transposase n=1 Tax=Okeania hirsuta TaxID=1458930 RepID=A0A3N6P5F1_9CYAN|nr:IS1 family transposase [Okeania hirsuta]